MQGDCNMFNCAAVIAGAACATMGMINQDPGSVLGCMSGGSQAVCENLSPVHPSTPRLVMSRLWGKLTVFFFEFRHARA